jgi:hypothetical protein
MKLRLENNRPKTKTKLWQRIFAWVSNIVAAPLARTKSVITPNPQPISLTSSTAGVCEKTGHFRYVIKGKRAYLTLRLENGACHRIIIGLGQGRGEVWVRRVNSENSEAAKQKRRTGS